MPRIFVPLDGTGAAESALPLARLLARRAGAQLVLAHVAQPAVLTESLATGSMVGGAVILPDPRTPAELRRARQDYLDDVVARTRAALRPAVADRRVPDGRAPDAADAVDGDDPGVRGVLVDGEPSAALHRSARDVGADLVVMASRGRRGLARLLFGSVTERVVQAGGVPVLVVPRGDDATGESGGGASPEPRAEAVEAPLPRHLLVVLDGSLEAEAVLAPAVSLARLLGSAVTLATVRDPGHPDRATLLPTNILDTTASGGRAGAPVPAEPPPTDVEPEGRRESDEAAYLDGLSRRLAADGCRATTRVLEGHPVVERLLACTEELGVDWFAITSSGRGTWTRLVEGSVADALMQRAPVPVLLLHPR